MSLDSKFNPAELEARMFALWETCGAFRANRPDRADLPPFSIVIPPPNVTGSLHMGHALNTSLQDIICRFQRMRGKDVLWQPGTDHAGIATQMVVERQLMERQEPNRRALGREAFLERVWAWKAESGEQILTQLRRLGASCDWARTRFTMDEGLSQAVRQIFVRLYRDGLIYKDKRLVNWDPKMQTAISDVEVEQVEIKGHLWHIAYPLVDEQGQETGERLIVATTRPETMLGDVAVAVHPEHETYQALIGRFVRLPLVGRLIPVVADSYADPTKGTGAVKITPAHDFNDFEVGRRHGLGLISVLDHTGHMWLANNAAFLADLPPSSDLNEVVTTLEGMDRSAARAWIIKRLEVVGALDKIVPHIHVVPHGERSGVVIEPRLTDQWYVDAKVLAGPALAAVREGRVQFVPKNWEKTYFDWLENIQPWCISRQLWWGHQIPAWYAPWGAVFVAETEDEACALALADARSKGIYSETELRAFELEPGRMREVIRQDEDVLDTWFSSGLWPFSTLGWPDKTPELQRFYPTSVLVTGFDIIFFWVARMMMMALYVMKEVPFRTVYIHALVRDQHGAKMSKSKGNVINPLELIDTYGADALRFTFASMVTQGRDVKLAPARVEGYRNFATKIWNAARFGQMNLCARSADFDPSAAKAQINRWVISEVARATEEVAQALEIYRFSEAAQISYRFVWNVFCDWYVELAKAPLQGEDGPTKDEVRATFSFVLDQILKMLHPFMPFITEALWSELARTEGRLGPSAASELLTLSAWPELGALRDPAAEQEMGWVMDLVMQLRSLRNEMRVPDSVPLSLVVVGADSTVAARVAALEIYIRCLVRIVDLSYAPEPPPQSAQLIVGGVAIALPLEGVLDLQAERVRLTTELKRVETEVNKLKARLDNPKFLASAAEEAIEDTRERLEEGCAQLEKLKLSLSRI